MPHCCRWKLFYGLVLSWLVLKLLVPVSLGADAPASVADPQSAAVELRRFTAAEATQGVGVDESAFYAIANRKIGRYDKRTGDLLARWEADGEHPLVHLNGGVVHDRKLYCAHSNYPVTPATSSVEIWKAETLEHAGNHSFGIAEGSLTWIDRHDSHWWACFAHYQRAGSAEPGRTDNRWTTVVKLDDQWQREQAWVFPAHVLERFGAYSCSGGAWGTDGLLRCTGHDRAELYVLRLPKAGATLELLATVACPIPGQGIACDRSEPGTMYGIDRRTREVVVARLTDRP